MHAYPAPTEVSCPSIGSSILILYGFSEAVQICVSLTELRLGLAQADSS